MFPVGNTANENPQQLGQTARESITWNGLSGLIPSLDVTNRAAATSAGRETFWAGILVGVAGGFAVPFVEKSLEAMSERWKNWVVRRPSRRDKAASSEAVSEQEDIDHPDHLSDDTGDSQRRPDAQDDQQ